MFGRNIQETRFRRFETVSGRYTACDVTDVLLGDDGINSIRHSPSGRVVIYILSATGTISTIAKWILASRTVLRMNIAVAADSPTALGVHASSVAWGHNGGLIVGKEGQGKTTTALACAGDGGSLLSEDISGICKGSDQWNIVSMPSMPGLDVRTSKLLKISLGDIVGKANLRRSTKFWLPPSQLPWMKRQASARLRGVFTLRRCSDSKPSVRPMPASEMLGHFLDSATRALITSSADMGGKLTSLGKVLAEVPCFELSTPEGAPHLVTIPKRVA